MVRPYLTFEGNCEEAFNLYKRAFGGKIEGMQKYGDAAPDPSLRYKVMHAEMQLTENGGIAGGDATWPYEKGHSVNVLFRVASEEKARAIWAVFLEEGKIIQDLHYMDGGLMGTIQDKFGFVWILTVYSQA